MKRRFAALRSLRNRIAHIVLLMTLAATAQADLQQRGALDSTSAESLVQRGRYIAIAGNCATCHTARGGDRFAGGVRFETRFGTLYSTNITPDAQRGIGRWTEQQFTKALREGVAADGKHLYPAFPYTSFTRLTDADIRALFAYLKTQPPSAQSPPKNALAFPFNQRRLLGLWKALYFQPGPYRPDPQRSPEWNRGAYLVQGAGHCSACHTPRNLLGAERAGWAYTGGVYLEEGPNGKFRLHSSVNLTQAATGLGSWSVDDIGAYLKTGMNSHMNTNGQMNAVIMNSTRHLSDADVRAMAVYLKSLPPKQQQQASRASAQMLRAGETLYDVHCGECHLPTGLGSREAAPALAGNPLVQAVHPASLINAVLFGPQATHPPLPRTWRKRMQPYAEQLSDEELAALASFLRSAWGNQAASVSAEEVEAQR